MWHILTGAETGAHSTTAPLIFVRNPETCSIMKRIVIDASSAILHKIEMLIRIGRYSQKIIDYALTCPSKEMALFMPE
ncbi:MAG: hypothetical protein P1P89_21825 [Desulfobacterales bacterium]|nr:hypothetical protein [Desulfobacterales bacterium]